MGIIFEIQKYFLIILCISIILMLFSVNIMIAQVLVHEYSGDVSVYSSVIEKSQQLTDELTALKKRGFHKIQRNIKSKYPFETTINVRIDTIDIKLEIEKLDSLINNTKSKQTIIKRDVSGRPIISVFELDTTEYDEQGRVQSIRSGSLVENDNDFWMHKVFYSRSNNVSAYDNVEFCGQSAKLTYDNSGKVKIIDYVFHPSDVSDNIGRDNYEYSKDGLVIKKTELGNLVINKKKNGEEDYKFVDKLVFRKEIKYVYVR